MAFRFEPLEIADVVLVRPELHPDARGGLWESFRAAPFRAAGVETGFVQENHLRSHRGVIRGLNYQLEPHSQGRLVQVLRGAVVAAAVDLREGSPSFRQHLTCPLSSAAPELLWVPSGFAFGVAFLEDDTLLSYKATRSEYTPAAKRSLRWDDPSLAIDWPFDDPILSEPDRQAPTLAEAEMNFRHPRSEMPEGARSGGRIGGRITDPGGRTRTRERISTGKFFLQ